MKEFEIAKLATGSFDIKTMDDAYRFGKFVLDAGFFPAFKKPTQVVVALQIAKDSNVPFSLVAQNIAFINGRATMYGDALVGVAHASGRMEDFVETIEGKDDNRVAVCTATVKGIKTPIARTFSVKDAKLARLWGKKGPWVDYPERMLQMRARSWALRDAGLTGGIVAREEVMDYPEGATRQVREVAAEVVPDGDWGAIIDDDVEPEDGAVTPETDGEPTSDLFAEPEAEAKTDNADDDFDEPDNSIPF